MKLTRDKIQRMIGSAGYGSSAGGSGGGGGDIIGYATQTWVKSLRWWGATFDPQATDPDNVTGALTGVTNITASGNITAGGNLTVTGNITSSGTITGATLAATTAMTINGKAVATQEWTGQNYVSIAFFSRLFQAYNGSTAVNPNDTTSTIDNIKAMFGFWTDQYLTALGKNPNVQPSSLYLSQLADVSIPSPTDGQVLTYSAQLAKWIASNASSGTDMATVWANLAAADSSKQIDISHLSNALSGYLPLTGGTMSNTNLVTNMNADMLDSRHATGFMYWEGAGGGYSNMNDISRHFYSSNGMIFLPNSSVDNSDMVGWTHFFSTSYTDGGAGNNSWCFQIACQAGTSNLQFRSLNGGTITDGSAWTTPWTKIIHAGNIASQTVANATNCLPLTGGTVTGMLAVDYNYSYPLILKGTVYYSTLNFQDRSGNWRSDFGWLNDNRGNVTYMAGTGVISTDSTAPYWSDDLSNFKKYTIIHTGNIGSQSVNYATSAGDAATLGGTAKSGLFTSLSSTWATNLSATIGGTTLYISSLNADYAGQLRYRRSIWGQSFNGTADVSGDLYLAGSNLRLFDYNNSADCYIVGYLTGRSRAIGVAVEGSSLFEFNDEEFYSAVGIYAASYVTALSDIRYKNVIRHFALDAETIANASLIQFRWKDGTDKATHVGGIAQEWQAFLPEAVHETKDGKLSMDYGVIAYTAAVSLAKKVIAQQQEIDDLKERLERLERLLTEHKDAETKRE